jgi:hypothetical protein
VSRLAAGCLQPPEGAQQAGHPLHVAAGQRQEVGVGGEPYAGSLGVSWPQ